MKILRAIIDLPPCEISFLLRLLFFIRSIPPKLLGRDYIGFCPSKPLLNQLEDKGFQILEKNDREIVLGVTGRFGKLKRGGPFHTNDFKNYDERESVKIATNFFLVEGEDAVLLSTETRILITGGKSRRRFTVYWMIVYPGSALESVYFCTTSAHC